MLISIRGSVLLMSICILTGIVASAQKSDDGRFHWTSTEFGVTYKAERADVVPSSCGCFWMQGGGTDVAAIFFHGLGGAVAFNAGHASNVVDGENLGILTFVAGPRYVYNFAKSRPRKLQTQIFAEGLFGGVHAFDSSFPTSSGTKTSANSLDMQFGGGINLFSAGGFGVRVLEMDYVRSSLPNGAGDNQNDFRIGAGIVYRFSKR
jgi:outer membrane immunogenic protein